MQINTEGRIYIRLDTMNFYKNIINKQVEFQ